MAVGISGTLFSILHRKNERVRDPLIHSAEKGNGYARMTCGFLGGSKGPQIFHGFGV